MRRWQRGQGLVEFSLLVPLFLLLVVGVADSAFAFMNNISIVNASREAARYAIINAEAWTDASSPDSNTIEGQAMSNAGLSGLKNNDTDIQITYWDMSSSPPTECGYWSDSNDSFEAETGYTEATCIKSGNEVQVALVTTYNAITGPMTDSPFPINFDIKGTTSMLIEVTP